MKLQRKSSKPIEEIRDLVKDAINSSEDYSLRKFKITPRPV
jgi:hypothetical protein